MNVQGITEEDIANYLANTPGFFERHAELLASIQLTSPHGHRAVSLQERQMEMLREKINDLVENGTKKIVLNLAEVPYVDSAGLGEIVRCYTTVGNREGNLKLLNLTKRIHDLLSITKLLTVFDTYDTEEEAVKSF